MLKKMFVISMLIFVLAGCIRKEILDDINIITVIGYDKGKNEDILGTVVVPVFQKEQPIRNKIMTVEADLSRDIMSEIQKESSEPLVYGKLQFIIYSQEVAEMGVRPLIDSIERDASVGSRVMLAVSQTNVNQLLQGQYGQRGTATYLSNLVFHNMELRDLPENNLHLFLYNLYSDGKDPYMPIIEKNSENIRIKGVALFKEDKMIGEISNEELLFFKLLVDKYVNGTHSITMDNEEEASIESIHSNRKMIIDEQNPLNISVILTIKAHIREYSKGQINPKVIKKVEKEFEENIEQKSMELIQRFQDLNVDPIGFGDMISSKTRKLAKRDHWKDYYHDLKVNVKADVTIIQTGVVE